MEKRIIKSEEQPNIIEYLNDGSYYYNYNPQMNIVEKQNEDGETVESTEYSYVQVHLYGIPNYKDITKAVIRCHISEDEEFDMINTYNKAILFEEEVNIDSYKKYLELLNEIKVNVKNSLK